MQGKAPKEIHAILTEHYLVSFLVGLRTYQAPLYIHYIYIYIYIYAQECDGHLTLVSIV